MLGYYYDQRADAPSNRPILLMEEERHRLARELHDGLLQLLTALNLSLDLCRRLSSRDDYRALEGELTRLKDCWEKSLTTMKELVVDSSPILREHESLREAMHRFARECEEQAGIGVSLDLGSLPGNRLSSEQSTTLFRIVQEALRNTCYHARASHVLIRAENTADSVQVYIEDDGTGFDLRSVIADYPHRGLGLAGMRERAQGVGGQLAMESVPGRGTTVTLTLPLSDRRGL
jgi:two-component system sensor histidine kinase DegS